MYYMVFLFLLLKHEVTVQITGEMLQAASTAEPGVAGVLLCMGKMGQL